MNWRRGALALLLGVTLAAPAWAAAQIAHAPLHHSHNPPPLGRKQGWLVISNRDWMDYSLMIDYSKEKIYLYRPGMGYGTVQAPSGTSITLALPKDNWDVYGQGDQKLKVRIREGRTTTLSLEPFGYAGNTGLNAVANDGDRVRSETLFFDIPQIIVQPPPVVVAPPPRPPVVIMPPPHRPPPHRPPHRPPPHRPPHGPGRDRNKGWGFSLFFD
ncbi:MAG: hypothetical protein LBJ46_05715 [Planctomycetota bacterium]|nr:hypothetical protein [Planctomycetota bacterium]